MNCKEGDMAVIVKSVAGNEGKIVRCIRVLSVIEADQLEYWSGPLWEVDKPLRSIRAGFERFTNHCPDAILRPIRPQSDDATDEMVQLLGKPSEVTA